MQKPNKKCPDTANIEGTKKNTSNILYFIQSEISRVFYKTVDKFVTWLEKKLFGTTYYDLDEENSKLKRENRELKEENEDLVDRLDYARRGGR